MSRMGLVQLLAATARLIGRARRAHDADASPAFVRRSEVPSLWIRDLRPDEVVRVVRDEPMDAPSAGDWETRSRARGHVPRGWRF